MSLLGERLLSVHDAFDQAGLRHAFGGAIALAYCTTEPRGTRDIDVNVFLVPDRSEEVLDALPDGITITANDRKTARRDGQVRIMWEDTPLDLFFETHSFHREIVKGVVEVPFEGTTIPILGCDALIVFKAMFNRTRDWADIEEMIAAGTEGREALNWLRHLVGESDPVVVRLAGIVGPSQR